VKEERERETAKEEEKTRRPSSITLSSFDDQTSLIAHCSLSLFCASPFSHLLPFFRSFF